MKSLIILFLSSLLFFGCSPSGSGTAPDNKNQAPKVAGPASNGNESSKSKKEILTQDEKVQVRQILIRTLNTWPALENNDRAFLIGAKLQSAISEVKQMNWSELTNDEVSTLINNFFDSSLNLITEKE